MPDWRIEPLDRSHDRSSFACGNTVLDERLQKRARQWQSKHLARCYVVVRQTESRVLGFYTLSSHHIGYETLAVDQAKGLPTINVPAVLVGRLAVDRSAHGQGFGRLLLIDALRRAQHLARQLGIRAVEVHAVDEAARRFYLKFGFTVLVDDPKHLLLPMHVIQKLDLPPLTTD